MKHRSILSVLILHLVTFGIYSWYWSIKTKGEMNRLGAKKIPTAWIWLIPLVGTIWWDWRYCKGVEHVTKGKLSGVLIFLLKISAGFGIATYYTIGFSSFVLIPNLIIGCIVLAILQNSFNSISLTKNTGIIQDI